MSDSSRVAAVYASEWSKLLLQKKGWIGADGIYSIPLDGVESKKRSGETETLLIFSDSIIGEVEDNELVNNKWSLVHNSVAFLTPNDSEVPDIDFYYKKNKQGNPVSIFEPQTSNASPDDIYWLGDGFVNNALDGYVYIFAYRVESLDKGIYPFRIAGVSLIKLPANPQPPFDKQIQIETPLLHSTQDGNITFGSAILVNTKAAGAINPDGYLYVYGVKGVDKQLVAARVKPANFEEFSKWRFWNGSDWVGNIALAHGIMGGVSNEMSISAMKGGKYMATYQQDTNSPNIVVQVGKSPVGPFHPAKKIWETPEIYEDIDFYTYNAKAHPHLSKPGELLISYNVNSFDFLQDIESYPNHVRPRFIRLKY